MNEAEMEICWSRFQGQTELNDHKPGDLRSAIEEAYLAENDFNEMLMFEINAAAGNLDFLRSFNRGVSEASDSNQVQHCNAGAQVSSGALFAL